MKSAEFWIGLLGLAPHPEGGWFREIYRSAVRVPESALPPSFWGDRAFSTSIFFLLKGGEFSAIHRLKTDEIWHFYEGSPLTLHLISPDGANSRFHLGPDAAAGQVFQAIIPAGTWFGARAEDDANHSLVGCTMSPGFESEDLELAQREDLLDLFPAHRGIIIRLTKPSL